VFEGAESRELCRLLLQYKVKLISVLVCLGVEKIQSVKLLLEHKVGLAFTNVGCVSCSTVIFSSHTRAGYENQYKNGYIQNFGSYIVL